MWLCLLDALSVACEGARTRRPILLPKGAADVFFHRVDRLVRRDSTFLRQSRFFEAPPHLAGKRIEVRFDPLDPAQLEIYCEGQSQGVARLVDAVVNGKLPARKQEDQ